MDEEIQALKKKMKLEWILVPRPPNKNIIGSRWVFRTKLKLEGSVERYNARLVAKGYTYS